MDNQRTESCIGQTDSCIGVGEAASLVPLVEAFELRLQEPVKLEVARHLFHKSR